MNQSGNDFLDELGELALGSRLKRLSEKMLADAAKVYGHFGMDVQPKWFTLLALLDRKSRVSVVEASAYLGLSQPALSQFCAQLSALKYIQVTSDERDSRKRYMSLTDHGRRKVNQMKPVWSAVDAAAKELCTEYENTFYHALVTLEKSLTEQSLFMRTQRFFEEQKIQSQPQDVLTFLPFHPDLACHFLSINTEWLKDMFCVEDIDKRVLGNPQENIIDKGGYIWFASHVSLGIVGTCALINHGDGQYELTKMGVLASARGLKVGEKLLQYVINAAQTLPLSTLFLLTNKKCEAAIHLYEKNGFDHDKDIMQQFGQSYARCDVAMRYHAP